MIRVLRKRPRNSRIKSSGRAPGIRASRMMPRTAGAHQHLDRSLESLNSASCGMMRGSAEPSALMSSMILMVEPCWSSIQFSKSARSFPKRYHVRSAAKAKTAHARRPDIRYRAVVARIGRRIKSSMASGPEFTLMKYSRYAHFLRARREESDFAAPIPRPHRRLRSRCALKALGVKIDCTWRCLPLKGQGIERARYC